jgi:hypothetical protein
VGLLLCSHCTVYVALVGCQAKCIAGCCIDLGYAQGLLASLPRAAASGTPAIMQTQESALPYAGHRQVSLVNQVQGTSLLSPSQCRCAKSTCSEEMCLNHVICVCIHHCQGSHGPHLCGEAQTSQLMYKSCMYKSRSCTYH